MMPDLSGADSSLNARIAEGCMIVIWLSVAGVGFWFLVGEEADPVIPGPRSDR